jgi:hypothetical protein
MTTGHSIDAEHGIGAYWGTIVPGQVERNYRLQPSNCAPAGGTLPQRIKRHSARLPISRR